MEYEQRHNSANVWNNKGNNLSFLKRYEEALDAYEMALTIAPNYALAWNGKGFALLKLKRYKEALVACDQALAIDPDFIGAWWNKGQSLLLMGRVREAVMAQNRAQYLEGSYIIHPKYRWIVFILLASTVCVLIWGWMLLYEWINALFKKIDREHII